MVERNYHLSKKDLGSEITLKPRVPQSSLVSKEGNIPRICVSSNLILCLKSITGMQKISIDDLFYEFRDLSDDEHPESWKINNGIFFHPAIYESFETPFLPPDASDFRTNKEKWYLKKTIFKRIGYLDFPQILRGQIEVIHEPYFYYWKEFEKEFSHHFTEPVKFSKKKIFI